MDPPGILADSAFRRAHQEGSPKNKPSPEFFRRNPHIVGRFMFKYYTKPDWQNLPPSAAPTQAEGGWVGLLIPSVGCKIPKRGLKG